MKTIVEQVWRTLGRFDLGDWALFLLLLFIFGWLARHGLAPRKYFTRSGEDWSDRMADDELPVARLLVYLVFMAVLILIFWSMGD